MPKTQLRTFFISCLILVPTFARADSIKAKCTDLEKCIHAVAELTGEKYIYDPFVTEGDARSTVNFELNRENANEILTLMLSQASYTRLALSEPGSFTIVRQRDARDSALPLFLADAEATPVFPKTWDLATLRYKLTNPELAGPVAINMRPFLPANSRVVPDEMGGQVILVAQIPILESSLRTLRSMDVKRIERRGATQPSTTRH